MDANKIINNLWQGSNPPKGTTLHQHGFNVLVLCAREHQYDPRHYPGVEVIHAPMDDGYSVPMNIARPAALKAAAAIRKGAKVLTVCHMGLNRSGLVSALTLWYLTGRSGPECVMMVQSARDGALFNDVFESYLLSLPGRRRRLPQQRAA
jgi:protein-tyrosine phosphatase